MTRVPATGPAPEARSPPASLPDLTSPMSGRTSLKRLET